MGLFGKDKGGTFGLDIGSTAVKVVQLAPSRGGYELETFAMARVPPDATSEGTIKDPSLFVDAIREAVDKSGVTSANAAISISGRELIVKKVQLPRVPVKELGDAISLEAEHHIPFAIDDVYLDYQIVSERGANMDVMLVAVKKSKVNEYVLLADEAGLTPVVVDLDSFALENQFELNNPEPKGEAVVLIDIGATVMKTNVVRGGSSLFARDVAFGGLSYTQAVAQRLGIPMETAEAAKQGQDVGVNWDDLIPALTAVSRELSLEIQRTFDYLASTTESERISRLVLSGGCAKLPGIDEFLSSSWGIPVEIARPFQNIVFDPNRFSGDELANLGPELAVAVGLAIRRPNDKPRQA